MVFRTTTSAFRTLHLLLTGLLLASAAQAQYTTPNTGIAYTLTDLVAISGGVFTTTSGTSFLQHADFMLSEADTLFVDEDVTWAVADSATIGIAGCFVAFPPNQLNIVPAVAGMHHQGMRFEESASVYMVRTSIVEGGGIKCLTEDLVLSHCVVSGQVNNATSGAALELSRGKAIIDHVDFVANERAAISSASNAQAAPRITDCNFIGNSYSNTNRPQINLGPSGTDTTFIRRNTVIGDPAFTLAGGIAFSSLLGGEGHVVIDSNLVVDNRYGITVGGGNITSVISNNIITDNNTQGNPMQGGSGINLNGVSSNISMVSGNQLSGNLWGVTLQGAVMTNFGDTALATFNPGNNSFANNGNGGEIYALFNNTPNPVPAMNNCWDFLVPMTDSTEVAQVISDVADDASLGEVFFMPFSACDFTTEVEHTEAAATPLLIYPNPAHGPVTIESARPLERYALFNASGQLVRSGAWPAGRPLVLDQLDAGLYLLKVQGQGTEHGQRIVVQ